MGNGTHINPPFRADHVGSLLRPKELRQAFRAFSGGEIVRGSVQVRPGPMRARGREASGGYRPGEHHGRRVSPRLLLGPHLVEATDGLGVAQARFDFRDETGDSIHFLGARVTGPVRRARSVSGDEFDFLKSVTRRTPKLTMPSPPTMHFWAGSGAVREAGYADGDAFFEDLARVYREEIAHIGGRGATYIQIDEVPLVMLCDGEVREFVRASGEDPDALVGQYIGLINASLAGRPEGMTLAMHLCRGNFKGKWLSEGGYQYVAERMFNEVKVDAFFLEYDTPRAGDFEPLMSVPEDKVVVLGLVSSKTPELESPDDLRRRIDEASHYVSLDRLALSPQCGFASAVSGNPVTVEDEMNKLRLIVDVARQVWD